MRIHFSTLLAATLLMLCIGVQVLEATGRWDGTFQDSGDEAVIVAVVLCIGSALVAARIVGCRASLTLRRDGIVLTATAPVIPVVCPVASALCISPPLSLRI